MTPLPPSDALLADPTPESVEALRTYVHRLYNALRVHGSHDLPCKFYMTRGYPCFCEYGALTGEA